METGVNFGYLRKENNHKSIVLWGGRGSGKSHDCIDYVINHALTNPFNSVVARRYDRHVGNNFEYFKTRLFDYAIEEPRILEVLKLTRSPMRITNVQNKSIVFFAGLDNPDNSIKALPKLNLGLLEEGSEADAERYMVLYNTIRDGANNHLITNFNPVSANNWTKRFFFESGFKSSNYHSTVEDNRFATEDYKQSLRDLKNVDRVRYEVDYLGMWGVLTDLIYFKNVELVNKIPNLASLVGAGIDFGIVDPTVIVKVYAFEGWLYVEVVGNYTNLPTTSPGKYNLVQKLKDYKIPCKIQADAEDKTSIHTLRAHGLDVIPALKGKGSIIGGIMKLQSFKGIRILNNDFGPGCYSDFRNYHRKKLPSGIILDDPADGQEDHTIDAVRYALSRTLVKF